MLLARAILLLVEPIQDLVVGTYIARTIKTDDREQTIMNPSTHVLHTFIEICRSDTRTDASSSRNISDANHYVVCDLLTAMETGRVICFSTRQEDMTAKGH